MIGAPDIGSLSAHWAVGLVDMLAKGLAILAATGLVSLCRRRSSAAVRHLAWAVGIMSLLVLPVLSLTLPVWQVPLLPRTLDAPVMETRSAHALPVREPAMPDGTVQAGPVAAPVAPRHYTPAATARAVDIRGESGEAVAKNRHWLMGMTFVWAVGVLVFVCRYAMSAVRLWYIGRQATELGGPLAVMLRDLGAAAGVTRHVSLLHTDSVLTPLACGVVRPRILIPGSADSWSDERLRLVLLHELSHVRRLDYLTQMLGWLACALHWLNPLVWYALRRLKIERELACDDQVLNAGLKPSTYAQHLLEIARGLRAPCSAAAVGMARPSRLEARLRAILRPGRSRGGVTRRNGLLAASLCASIVVPLAAIRPTAMAQEAAGKRTVPAGARDEGAEPLVSHDVAGRVLGPDGRPAAGATVCQYRTYRYARERTGVHRRLAARPDGSFVLKGLACDRAKGVLDTIVVIQPGYGIVTYPAWAHPEKSTVALELPGEAVLKGVVIAQDGQPVAGASVTAVSATFRPAPSAKRLSWSFNKRTPLPQLTSKTDSAGLFTVSYLPKAFQAEIDLYIQHNDYAHDLRTVRLEDVRGVAKIKLERGGAIEGKVVHAGSGKPARGVTVSASGKQNWYSTVRYGMAATDSEGHYLIRNLPPKVYSIRMQLPREPELVAGTLKDVTVVAGRTTAAPDLVVTKGGVLSGKVVDADTGAAVAPAWVYAEGAAGMFRAYTKADGTFQIRCPEGEYELVRSSVPRGYLRKGTTNRRQVTVREGQTISGLDFEVAKAPRTPTITGKVVDGRGAPVSGARVHYLCGTVPHRRAFSRKETSTSAGGAFSVPNTPPHETVRMGIIDQAGRRGRAHTVSVGAAAPQDVIVELLPMATLTGRVVDPKGQAIPQAWVSRSVHPDHPASPWPLEHTRTAADGTYELRVMPEEVVRITGSIAAFRYTRLDSPGQRAQQFTVQNAQYQHLRGPGRFTPAAGRRYTLDDIVLARRRKIGIEGQVLDPAGRPVPRARVKLFSVGSPRVETCDDQGSFDFTDVRAYGRPIWVKAQDAGGKWAVQVEVDPDSPRAVLRLAEAGRVAGRVVDQAGRPLADAEVAAYVEMASGLTRQCGAARTDASGTYRIDGLMTGCRGYVHVRKSGYARKSSEKRRFESGPVMQFEPLVVLKADSSIAGLVADTGGNPLKGARLLCTAPGPHFRRAVADSRGRYRIDGLPDVGSLTVEAQHPGSRPARRDQVKAGSTDINFVLEPAIR